MFALLMWDVHKISRSFDTWFPVMMPGLHITLALFDGDAVLNCNSLEVKIP